MYTLIKSLHKLKNKNYKGIIYINIVVLLFSLSISSIAGTTSVHTNMLFQHSYFKNKHYRITCDLIRYDLSSAFKNLTPVKASFAENDTNNIALFSASNNKLYLMSVALTPETSRNMAILTARDPKESPVGTANSLSHIFAGSSKSIDTVFLALVDGNSKVLIYHIETQNFTVAKVEELSINPPSIDCQIVGLFGGPDFVKQSEQTCLWVTGTHGLIRYFTWNGSAWSTEIVHDVAIEDTITALCKQAAGTSSGKIYEYETNSFVYKTRPSSTYIKRITDQGAICDNIVLKKSGNNWKAFNNITSGNYQYFNFIARTDGLGVELLDHEWKFYVFTLEDTLTSFDVYPENIAQFINNGTYLSDAPDTVYINLIDNDGNCLIPKIILNNSINLTDSLKKMHPDTIWNNGFQDLDDTVVTLILETNSIKVEAKTRLGRFIFDTYKKYWQETVYEKSVKWNYKNKMTIQLGTQSLTIQNNNIFVKNNTNRVLNNINRPVKIKLTNNRLTFNFKNNSITSIHIYNLSGRLLTSHQIPPGINRFTLPCSIPSGVLCIEYGFIDGRVKRNILPALK